MVVELRMRPHQGNIRRPGVRSAHVLMPIERYRDLTAQKSSIVDQLAMPEDVEFEPGCLSLAGLQVADLL